MNDFKSNKNWIWFECVELDLGSDLKDDHNHRLVVTRVLHAVRLILGDGNHVSDRVFGQHAPTFEQKCTLLNEVRALVLVVNFAALGLLLELHHAHHGVHARHPNALAHLLIRFFLRPFLGLWLGRRFLSSTWPWRRIGTSRTAFRAKSISYATNLALPSSLLTKSSRFRSSPWWTSKRTSRSNSRHRPVCTCIRPKIKS